MAIWPSQSLSHTLCVFFCVTHGYNDVVRDASNKERPLVCLGVSRQAEAGIRSSARLTRHT